jgi:hypothetical protein
MKANKDFLIDDPEFWAIIKGIIIIPTMEKILGTFNKFQLFTNKIFYKNTPTDLGNKVLSYFEYRADILNNEAQFQFMSMDEARELYEQLLKNFEGKYKIEWKVPINKQAEEKRNPAFLTGCVNMLIQSSLKGEYTCKYDAKEISSFTSNKFPVRSLSRRVDGSFPGVINPIALWEIKEYYYTTSFGSRIADGVYETMLDGYELKEVRKVINRPVFHYLFIDAKYTWWTMGKSYLCRIVDLIHMGLLTECIIGKHLVERVPVIVEEWKKEYEKLSPVLYDTSEK